MGRPVVHFEIAGSDGPALQQFYRDLFDWKVDADNEFRYGMVSADDNGGGIGGGISQGPPGYPGHVTVYVEVPDVEGSLAKAESMGATRMMGPETVMPGLEIGLFTDPQGHVIGVMRNTASA